MKELKNPGRLFKDTVNSWIGDKVPRGMSSHVESGAQYEK